MSITSSRSQGVGACGRRGLHMPDNLQLLTPEENLAKANRL